VQDANLLNLTPFPSESIYKINQGTLSDDFASQVKFCF
jgi:hypothetical protein